MVRDWFRRHQEKGSRWSTYAALEVARMERGPLYCALFFSPDHHLVRLVRDICEK